MQNSHLEQARVADLIDWNKAGRLDLNPAFQRLQVWTPDGRSYLIDTILQGLPMPKVFIRTRFSTGPQEVIREVVDGQQRIRAILDFADDKLRLNKRAGQFAGMYYRDLDEDTKQNYLAYPIALEQLINASDELVLEVFARLNTYSVPLNAAEHRHAKFQGDFKSAVHEFSSRHSSFWQSFGILSLRQRVRMEDDQLAAEMFGCFIDGVVNSGRPYLDELYRRFDADISKERTILNKSGKDKLPDSLKDASSVPLRADETVAFITRHFDGVLRGGFFSRSPQLLILFAAIGHLIHGIPFGDLGDALPSRPRLQDIDLELAAANLVRLGNVIEEEDQPQYLREWISVAGGGQTTRIASRSVRFRFVWNAIVGNQQIY